MLDQIQQLYAIEQKAADEQLSEADILQLRQDKAMPILESLGKWMQLAYVEVLPKSAIGMALAYSIQRWLQLMIYATDGKLNIDNNLLAVRTICSPEAMKPPGEAPCFTR